MGVSHIQIIEALQEEIKSYSSLIKKLNQSLDELLFESENCNCFVSDVIQKSCQHLNNRYGLLETLVTERLAHLGKVKTSWLRVLNSLDCIEEWLKVKESIATEADFTIPIHTRDSYLEAMKLFENLNHCIQDNIHLLREVNTGYQMIALRELDVNDSFKIRVRAVNEKWHKLHKIVLKNQEVIKKVLQSWEEFDEIKQHLLLFLTETDLKLTSLEQSEEFCTIQDCEAIEDDFKIHEDELSIFNSAANYVKSLSECFTSAINCNVEDVHLYWKQLYERLLKLKDIKENNVAGAPLSELFLKEQIDLDVQYENSPSKDIVIDQNINRPENEYVKTEDQSKNFTELSLPASKGSVQDNDVIDSSTTRQDESNDDQDFIKDLLAALQEAEGRMDDLETVLTELTPNGIDDNGPNYSRLLAACRSSIDVIQHLSNFLENKCESERDIQLRTKDMINRWESIEISTLNKEQRSMDIAKSWDSFSKNLQDIESWLQDALEIYKSQAVSNVHFKNIISLVEKHKELTTAIWTQKKNILSLNVMAQNFLASSKNQQNQILLNERINDINEHWEHLCSTAVNWQNKLQSEFLESTDFKNTLSEMELWLNESEEKINELPALDKETNVLLHTQHTELYALKQQLESCSNRLQNFLEVSHHLLNENNGTSDERILGLQSRLESLLNKCQSILALCIDKLLNLRKLWRKLEGSDMESIEAETTPSLLNAQPTQARQCCNFLFRVVRASFPIQAILLLLLGAAILMPLEEEEELSCRLSNNFAKSLNPMLHYPDGPPPV